MKSKSRVAGSAKSTKKQQSYQVEQEQENGSVRIADSVIASIAGIAATEVDGVARLYGNITGEIVSKIGMNVLSKGVRVTINEGSVRVQLNCEMVYGVNIQKVTNTVQERVKQAIENMTSLTVDKVNVHVVAVTSA
ncbi:MAG: Asp23/Gls24 family envelope stress response protein [Lachnospiraceae bacterium]|nr:Asp23/Gls24 family envelope stress response protein [Lachnospiraceae bacterium]